MQGEVGPREMGGTADGHGFRGGAWDLDFQELLHSTSSPPPTSGPIALPMKSHYVHPKL